MTTRVESGRLIIGFNACISTTRPVRIYATAKDIECLEVSGSGTIAGKNKIKADSWT